MLPRQRHPGRESLSLTLAGGADQAYRCCWRRGAGLVRINDFTPGRHPLALRTRLAPSPGIQQQPFPLPTAKLARV